MRLLSVLCVAGLAALSSAADASTTFVFNTSEDNVQSKQYSQDGITLTVTAATFRGPQAPTPYEIFYDPSIKIGIWDQGLGVDNDLNGADTDSNNNSGGPNDTDGFGSDAEGYGLNDLLVFDFGQQVRLDSVSFGRVDSNDTFTFFAGDPLTLQFQDKPISPDTITFGDEGQTFGIGARLNNDDFRVTAISVSAVPEPATWLMMLAGFALTGFALKRRKVGVVAA